MRMLAGHVLPGDLSVEMAINGFPVGSNYHRFVVFIGQNDVLLESLTVYVMVICTPSHHRIGGLTLTTTSPVLFIGDVVIRCSFYLLRIRFSSAVLLILQLPSGVVRGCGVNRPGGN